MAEALTRRETFAMAGLAAFPTTWTQDPGTAPDDYRDCISALAQNLVPELEQIFLQANFHAIVALTTRLKADAQDLRGTLQNFGVVTGNVLTEKQFNAFEKGRAGVSDLATRLEDLVNEKSAFEGSLQSSAARIRVSQQRLVSEVAQPGPKWSTVTDELSNLLGECATIRKLIDAQPADEVARALRVRLDRAESFIRDCRAFVLATTRRDLLASTAFQAPAVVPSLAKCRQIVGRHVNPTLWWPPTVRALAKPAFAVVSGTQADLAKRTLMVRNALHPIDFLLAGKTHLMAAEIAKGN